MTELTKKAILESFKKLLLKKPFSQITISDITSECNIARMTFYYHFNDIYHLITWAIEESFKSAAEDYKQQTLTWRQAYLQIFKNIYDDRNFIMKILPSLNLFKVERFLCNIVEEYLGIFMDNFYSDYNLTEEQKKCIFGVYQYTLVGFLINWVNDEMKTDPEIIVKNVTTALTGTFKHIIGNFGIS